jgi:hypothetical protein
MTVSKKEVSKKRNRHKSSKSDVNSTTESKGKKARVIIAESDSDSDLDFKLLSSKHHKKLHNDSSTSSVTKPVVIIE